MKKKNRLALLFRVLASVLFLVGPLASCSSDPEPAQAIRAMSVPDDGYKPPAKNSRKLAKPKIKVVSFQTNYPVDI
jgi:hypothetical protein